MIHHQIAEAAENLHMTVLCPLFVLLASIAIEEFIAHGQLCQQGLIAVGHFLVGVVGDDNELVDDGKQMRGLLVGQRTDGGVMVFFVVVAEGVETQVVEHFR